MDNLKRANEKNCSFSDDVQKEPNKSKDVQASSLSQSTASDIEEIKKPAVMFISEMGDVVDAGTGNLEAKVTLEKDAVKSRDSPTVESCEFTNLNKVPVTGEEPYNDFSENHKEMGIVTSDIAEQGNYSCNAELASVLESGDFGSNINKHLKIRYKIKSPKDENVNIEQKISDNYETSIEPSDVDLEQNKRFVEWLPNEIETGNKEILFDKVLGENILKSGGVVCEKYLEKKRELFGQNTTHSQTTNVS